VLKTIKQKTKKPISVLAALMLALCLVPAVPVTALGADTVTFAISAPDDQPSDGYSAGDTFSIPVSITENVGFAGVNLEFVFDSEALELVGYDNTGNAFPSVLAAYWMGNPAANRYGFTDGIAALTSTNHTETGFLFKATFKVKEGAAGGTYEIGVRPAENAAGNVTDYRGDYVATSFPAPVSIKVYSAPVVVPPAEVTVAAPTANLYAGDDFVVSVDIADNPGFAGAAFTVGFDEDVLEFVGFDVDDYLLGANYVTDEDNASIGYVGISADEDALVPVNGASGTLFKVKFKVKEGAAVGATNISVGLKDDDPLNLVDSLGDAVDVNFTAASVTIASVAAVTVGSVAGNQAPGDTFTVPVSISGNPGFAGAAFTLSFDPAALELVSISDTGSIFEGNLYTDLSSASAGFFAITYGDEEEVEGVEVANGNGVLFYVAFKVVDDAVSGTYDIDIALKDASANNFVDEAGDPLPVAFTGGTVNIVAPVPITKTTVSVGNVEAYSSTQIRVPVSIALNDGFSYLAIRFNYDTTKLDLTGIDWTGTLLDDADITKMWLDKSQIIPEGFMAILGGRLGNIEGDGVLFYLVFDVLPSTVDCTAEVKIDLLNDLEANFASETGAVYHEFRAGTVTITGLLPVALSDLSYTLPQTEIYDGTGKTVAVTLADDSKDIGTPVVYYTGDYFESGYLDGSYDKSSTPPTEAGTYTISVEGPATSTYAPYSFDDIGTLTISKAAVPTVTWPTAAAITYGDAVSTSVLSGGSTDLGSFAWDSSVASLTPEADTYSYPVNFTASLATINNYQAITNTQDNVSLTVNKAPAPAVTWPTAANITYGATVSTSALTPASNSFGSFAWDTSVASLTPDAGTYNYAVVFTPTAATAKNYQAVTPNPQDVELIVDKAPAPAITWPTAAPVREGSTLADSVLSSGSTEYGTFAWTTPSTALPTLGTYTYEVTFTPSAATSNNYEAITPTTQDVSITVVKVGNLDDDGAISISDAGLVLRYVNGLITLTPEQLIAADFDGDGYVTSADVTLIVRAAFGL
jgi:hypothetical protein